MFNLAFCSTIWWSETRLKDLFHFMWSCSTFSGRCSTNCGTVLQKVELFHKKWNCSTLCRSSWMLPHFMGSCSTFSVRCSTNCGTVPQKVELFHKKWNCSTKSGTVPKKWNSSTLCWSSWILPWVELWTLTHLHFRGLAGDSSRWRKLFPDFLARCSWAWATHNRTKVSLWPLVSINIFWY